MTSPQGQFEFVGGPFDGHVYRFEREGSLRPIFAIAVNGRTMRDPSQYVDITERQRIVYYELEKTNDRRRYRFLGYLRAEKPVRRSGPIATALSWLRSLPTERRKS